LLLHRPPKKNLLILCLITLCAFPALSVAGQSRLPEDPSRFAVQPLSSIEDQEWMDSHSIEGRFKGYRPVSENSIGVPKDKNTSLDLINVYTTEKQVPASQQETMKIGWIIAPLFVGYTNSPLVANIPIGVILKLRF
jgi:hypothetical protein